MIPVVAAPALAVNLTPPDLNFAAMAPLLILFGAASVGVLVEAFVTRRYRHATQLLLSLAALVAAFIAVVRLAQGGRNSFTAAAALAVDGPTLFLQGTLALLGIVAILLVADRSVDRGGAFVAQAAVPVGGEADRRQ